MLRGYFRGSSKLLFAVSLFFALGAISFGFPNRSLPRSAGLAATYGFNEGASRATSNAVPLAILPLSAGISLVQHASKDAGTTTSSALPFTSSNIAGDLIVVAVRASSTGQVFTVTDSNLNTYRKAVQFNETVDATTVGVFYAENIRAGANTVRVSDTFSGTFRLAVLEYSGIATSNSLDSTAAAQGTSASPSSGNLTTTAAGDLLFGIASTANPATFTPAAGYAVRESVPAASPAKLIAEDRVQTSAGTASAGATLAASDTWASALAAFKAAGGAANAPTIANLSPTSGVISTTVTITGTNFGSLQGSSTVTFNGTPATPRAWSATGITVPVPSAATSGNVVVTVAGIPSNGIFFTVTVPPPSIGAIVPNPANIGTPAIISGANFGSPQGSSTVAFNGALATPTSWSPTSITVPVSNGATSGNVVVTVGGVASNPVPFTVSNPGPSITSLSLSTGAAGTPVTLTGTNFGPPPGSSTVTFNGTLASPTTWSDTSIIVPVPTGATSGNIVVTVGGVASNGINFTMTQSAAPIVLVQHASTDAGTTTSTTLSFASANTAGNWIGVVVRASTSGQVFTVADSRLNNYRKAVQLNETVDGTSVAIYYAENIAPGANAVSVSNTFSGTLRLAILEYSGVAIVNSVDGFSSAQGTSAAPATATFTTTRNGDLLLGAVSTANPADFTAGTSYTIRDSIPFPPSKLISEDQIQTSAGTASANASLAGADDWGAVVAAFASVSGAAPAPISVAVAPTSVSVTIGGAPQAFTTTLQNDSQNKGVTWSLSGAGCSGTTCGLLTGVTPTSITYTAPNNVPSPARVTLTATSVADSSKSSAATITVIPGSIGVTLTPKRGGITTSQSRAFSAVVTGDTGGAGVTWATTGGTLVSQTPTSVTFSSAAPGSFTITATSNANNSQSASATIGVTDLAAVATYHNNLSRDGSNPKEYALTPSSVNSSTFGKLFSCPLDGAVYAQPLWVPNVPIGGGRHNVIFVATQHDSVYAFDADAGSGAACTQYWKVSMLDVPHGVPSGVTATPVDPNDTSETGDISGEIGITGSPVVDATAKTLYIVSKSREGSAYHQRLHALSLADGTEKVSPPMDITSAITVPGSADTGDSTVGCTASSGNVPFCPLRENQRPGLVLSNGVVYVAWASHGDIAPYHGWVMGFDATTLALVSKFNASPNGRQSGIWMSGAAPAVDNSGNLYLITGNGDFDPTIGSYGDSFLKLTGTLSVADWFSPFDQSNLDSNDLDLGSGGAAILVDLPPSSPFRHLIVGGGKGTNSDGELYVMNRDNLGHFNSTSDTGLVVQEFPLGSSIFSTSAFWQNRLYIAGVALPLTAFDLNPSTSLFNSTPSSQSASTYGFPGATPSVSSSGTLNGIVWAIDSSANGKSDPNPTRVAGPAVLHAYDATNLAVELWNSTQGIGNTPGNAVKFTVPTVANGKVYIGTRGNDSTQGSGTVFGQLDVFGLLPN